MQMDLFSTMQKVTINGKNILYISSKEKHVNMCYFIHIPNSKSIY